MSNLLKNSFLIVLAIIFIQNLSAYFINQLSPIQSQDAAPQEKLIKDLFVFGGLAILAAALAWMIWLQAKQRDRPINSWDYAKFLNYCVECRLLQRVSGRSRFLHRELLEHFANKTGGV